MFFNGQEIVPMQHTLITMEHPQLENGNPSGPTVNWSWNHSLFREAKRFQLLGHEIPTGYRNSQNGPPQYVLVTGNI